jgi:hypothetical protein
MARQTMPRAEGYARERGMSALRARRERRSPPSEEPTPRDNIPCNDLTMRGSNVAAIRATGQNPIHEKPYPRRLVQINNEIAILISLN